MGRVSEVAASMHKHRGMDHQQRTEARSGDPHTAAAADTLTPHWQAA